MGYHMTAHRVAPDAPEPHHEFREAIRRAAGVALHSPALTAADSQMLRDLRRADARYQFRAVDRLLDLLATIPDEEPALVLLDDIRGAIVSRRARNQHRDLRADYLAESTTQHDADDAMLRVLCAPHPELALVRKAIDASERHKVGVERLLDDLFAEQFALAQGDR